MAGAQTASQALWPELVAPQHWRVIDFISDIHLHAGASATAESWRRYLQQTRADALFILGDLFEVWVGDDALDDDSNSGSTAHMQERAWVQSLATAGKRLDLYFMQGNRDFLAGERLMSACHMTLLPDPTVLVTGQQRWLLTHGDALCLADIAYMEFRQLVRSPQWQTDFLAQPLARRRALATDIRARSEARKQDPGLAADTDVDDAAALRWLEQAKAPTMVHGHTHKPALHQLGGSGHQRIVLSDWDSAATPPRAQILRLELPVPAASVNAEPRRINAERA